MDNFVKELQALIKGKYGLIFIIIAGLLLIKVFIRVLPVLFEFALGAAILYFAFKFLEKKK
jgi:hypothetical protein